MDTQMVLTHTGKIYFNRSLGLEFLTVGDYGKENNIKADFLGLTKKIEGVQHHDVDLMDKWVATISSQKGCPMKCTFCDVHKYGFFGNASLPDLEYQIRYIIEHEGVRFTNRFNVHYARMGEPTWNPAVLDFTESRLDDLVKECGLHAEYIYCDHADVCSVYKEGKCFRKTTLFGVRCEFGRIACVDGGTKKTKMYGRVYSEAKDSERYHKLSYPNNTYIAKIGDGAFLAPPYVRIERGPDSRLFCHNPGFGCNRLFVSIDELTPDNINRICTYHPRAMLGGEIESYQTETIPIFLHQLSKLFPEQYSTFIKAFPDYELKAPDYRGKYAKLSTCNRELTYRDAHGNSFRFDGDELVCDKYRIGGFMPFSSSGYAQMRIPVTDDMQVKITDSNQVTDQTVLI